MNLNSGSYTIRRTGSSGWPMVFGRAVMFLRLPCIDASISIKS